MLEDYITDGFASSAVPSVQDKAQQDEPRAYEQGEYEHVERDEVYGQERRIHPAHRPPIEAADLPPDERAWALGGKTTK